MKKSLLLFVLVIFLLIPFIKSEVPSIPSSPITEINPDTGLPRTFESFKKISSNLSDEEKRKEYLKQEWTKILAENKFFSPVLFYTDQFFSFFNPLWKIIFGMEFSWSWMFILSLVLWIFLIIIAYNSTTIILSPLTSIIISISISSLFGVAGVFQKIINQLTSLISNVWFVLIFIAILVFILFFYARLSKQIKEKHEKSEEELNRQKLKANVKIAEAFIKGITKD